MIDWQRRRTTPPAADLASKASATVIELKDRWIVFVSSVHFRDDVTLADRIEVFAAPAREYISRYHPAIFDAPAGVFWMTILTAVIESKTHTPEEVNKAKDELALRYGRKS